MIQATVRMDFAPSKIDEATQILGSIVERTRVNPGCFSCSVFRDVDNKHMIVFEEKWKSDEDLQRHLRSEDYQKVLLVMEMAIIPPEIRFDIITSSSGVETIEEARSPKGNEASIEKSKK
jgi:quinol monooxygenase YgiN